MRSKNLTLLVTFVGLTGSIPAFASNIATARGFGANDSQAIEDAKKKAIAKVCGETIVGSSRLQTDTEKRTKLDSSGSSSKSMDTRTKSSEDNIALVGGSIKSFKVLEKGEDAGNKYVDIHAVVADCKSGDAIQTSIDNKVMISQLAKINQELKNLSASDSIVKNPRTIAQKYHNARTLAQRGEIDNALKAYQAVLKEKIIFADPIQDLVTLAKRLYGVEGAKRYIEKSLSHLRERPEYLYAISLADEDVANDWDEVRRSSRAFPPLAFIDLKMRYGKCFSKRKDTNPCLKEIMVLPDAKTVSNQLIALEKSGEILQFYIDSNKSSRDTEDFSSMFSERFWAMFDLEKTLNEAKTDASKLDLLRQEMRQQGHVGDAEFEKKMDKVRETMQSAPPNPYSYQKPDKSNQQVTVDQAKSDGADANEKKEDLTPSQSAILKGLDNTINFLRSVTGSK